MLNFIKDMINDKLALTESVGIDPILEETMTSIDDSIVLGEEGDDLELPNAPEEGATEDPNTNSPEEDENSDDEIGPGTEEEPGDDDSPAESDNTDILDSPIDGGPEAPSSDNSTDEILNSPIEDGPTEPINKDEELDDILSTSIDLKSNTMKDVLPVPPEGANDAIAGDDMQTRVDSGFEKEEEPETNNESGDILTEAITLGDAPAEGGDSGGDAAAPTGDITTDPPPAEVSGDASGGDAPADGSTEGENSVTSAVRDKVAESELDTAGEDKTVGKDELLKKLGSITKSLEDAKKAVMNSIN